jgi:tRNA(adenine34) deaminase
MEVQNDEHFMRLALAEAHAAGDAEEVPVGAVVVARGRVIGRGHNLCERLHDFTAHAEIQVLAPEKLGCRGDAGVHSGIRVSRGQALE